MFREDDSVSLIVRHKEFQIPFVLQNNLYRTKRSVYVRRICFVFTCYCKQRKERKRSLSTIIVSLPPLFCLLQLLVGCLAVCGRNPVLSSVGHEVGQTRTSISFFHVFFSSFSSPHSVVPCIIASTSASRCFFHPPCLFPTFRTTQQA